jgi:hypothetical protein
MRSLTTLEAEKGMADPMDKNNFVAPLSECQ